MKKMNEQCCNEIALEFVTKFVSFAGVPEIECSIMREFLKTHGRKNHPWFHGDSFMRTSEWIEQSGGIEQMVEDLVEMDEREEIWTILGHFSDNGVCLQNFLQVMLAIEKDKEGQLYSYSLTTPPQDLFFQFCSPKSLAYVLKLVKEKEG